MSSTETEKQDERDFDIVVNAQPKSVPTREVTFDQIVALAFDTPSDPNTTFTVLYRKAQEPRHEGAMVEGDVVEVKKKGTVFSVTPTTKS